MKKLGFWALTAASSLALTVAYGWFGRLCWTWLYQPQVPQKLLDMEK